MKIVLPGGETALFGIGLSLEGICSVIKDAGDDPDITDGVIVTAQVIPRNDGHVKVDGGEGVGRTTLPGLAVPPGNAAINPVPLKYICAEIKALLPQGADVIISIPGGEELAKRTFNPRLGITGGLSVLGTTGRVEPWSSRAYQESLLPKLDIAKEAGVPAPLLVPGAKGEQAAIGLGFSPVEIVHAGNYFGMMLDAVRSRGFRQVILAGHTSKLAKIARGDLNTHSRRSVTPLDVLEESAASISAKKGVTLELKHLPTTEAALRALLAAGGQAVLDETARRVAAAVRERFGLTAAVYLTDGKGNVVGRHEGLPGRAAHAGQN